MSENVRDNLGIYKKGKRGGLGSFYFMIGIMFYLMLWFYVID